MRVYTVLCCILRESLPTAKVARENSACMKDPSEEIYRKSTQGR